MTKTCGKKQTNKSLPDVCNANLRNAEHTGEADARVALQARLEKLPSLELEQEPGILMPHPSESGRCPTAFSLFASWCCPLQGESRGDEDFSH